MGAADSAIQFALAQVGKPYVFGATGPDSFDCSGLILAAYRQAGVQLPRTTYQQILVGTPVAKSDLQPGDLVFPSVEHVQLYLGNGKIVEAPHSGATVRVASMWGFYAARRVAAPGSVVHPGADPASNPTGGQIPASDPFGVKQTVGDALTMTGWALMVAGGAGLMVVGSIVLLADTKLGGAVVQGASRGLVNTSKASRSSGKGQGNPDPSSSGGQGKPDRSSKGDDQAPEDDGYQPRHARGVGRRRRYVVTDEDSGERVFAYGRADVNTRRAQAREAGRRVRVERA